MKKTTRRAFIKTAAFVLATSALGIRGDKIPQIKRPVPAYIPDNKMCGINIGSSQKNGLFEIAPLVDRVKDYVNLITITPCYLFDPFFTRIRDEDDPLVYNNVASRASMEYAVNYIRGANPNIEIMLKPHINVNGTLMEEGLWSLLSEEKRWDIKNKARSHTYPVPWYYDVYFEKFMIPFAGFAEELGVEHLSFGTELVKAARAESMFRRGIDNIRKRYSGKLTFSAKTGTYTEVKFWDALDYISTNYYPYGLTESTLESEVKKDIEEIAEFGEKQGRGILITETGIPSFEGALENTAFHASRNLNAKTDLDLQKRYLDLLLGEVLGNEGIMGMSLWTLKPYFEQSEERREKSFFWLDKPAEEVIRKHYKKHV